jgi:NAD(P)H-flavin reductase
MVAATPNLALSEMPTPRKIRCAVAEIIDHGSHVYTVELTPETPVPLFRPGQFLHLALDEYDPSSFWPESRVFSIASSPTDRRRLLICYSVKGAFTMRMERELRQGGLVWVKLPYGDFVVGAEAEAVLFAGGTGISAFTAFIAGLGTSRAGRVHLCYGARSPELLLFRKEIELALVKAPSFRVTYCAERGNLKAGGQFADRLQVRQGVLSADFAAQDGLLSSSAVFYLSGPPAMLKALSSSLLALGVAPERIRIDAWE